MSAISRWVTEDVNREQGAYVFDNYREAVKSADALAANEGQPVAVIELEFEYSDSSLVYATDGSTVWPPKGDT